LSAFQTQDDGYGSQQELPVRTASGCALPARARSSRFQEESRESVVQIVGRFSSTGKLASRIAAPQTARNGALKSEDVPFLGRTSGTVAGQSSVIRRARSCKTRLSSGAI